MSGILSAMLLLNSRLKFISLSKRTVLLSADMTVIQCSQPHLQGGAMCAVTVDDPDQCGSGNTSPLKWRGHLFHCSIICSHSCKCSPACKSIPALKLRLHLSSLLQNNFRLFGIMLLCINYTPLHAKTKLQGNNQKDKPLLQLKKLKFCC